MQIGNPQQVGGVNGMQAGQTGVINEGTQGIAPIAAGQQVPIQTAPIQAAVQTPTPQVQTPEATNIAPVVEERVPSSREALQTPSQGVITIELALIQIDLSQADESTQSIALPLAGQRHECKHGESYIVSKADAEMFANRKAPFVIYHKDAELTVNVG